MAEDTDETADEDQTEYETYPWANIQPNSRVVVEASDLVYTGDLSSNVAQNNDSYFLMVADIDVVRGGSYVNTEKPSDGTTAATTGEEETRSTDYRIVSEDSGVGSFVKGSFTTNEVGSNVYDEAEITDTPFKLFFNGMMGNRLGRTLDFNGRNFARWTDDGYLVKGLYQATQAWRDANGSQDRSRLAGEGKAPRVSRQTVPRFKVDGSTFDEDDTGRILIDVSKLDPSDPESGYEIHIFDANAFEQEFGSLDADIEEMDRDQWGLDVDSVLGYTNHSEPESILEQAEVGYAMYEGDGWQSSPEGWTLEYDDGSTDNGFGLADMVDDDAAPSFEEKKAEFVEEAISALPDGADPEDAFPSGISGIVEQKSGMFPNEPTEDDVAEIRDAIYTEVSWLDSEDTQ